MLRYGELLQIAIAIASRPCRSWKRYPPPLRRGKPHPWHPLYAPLCRCGAACGVVGMKYLIPHPMLVSAYSRPLLDSAPAKLGSIGSRGGNPYEQSAL